MAPTFSRQRLLLHLLTKRTTLAGKASQGFTLIELLVVIVILGVLGAVGYGAYVSQIQRANINSARVAAVGAAKNCAALLATGENSSFEWGVNTSQILISPAGSGAAACLPLATSGTGQAFRATAGGTNANSGSGGANINITGSVTPL